LVVVQRHHVESSHVYTYHCEGQQDGGGLYLLDLTDDALTCLLPSPDGQILGLDLSFDGKRILFSWRRGEFYRVYTMNLDGSDLNSLTDGLHHDYDACWLPDGGIAFLSTRTPRYAYCWTSPAGILFRMEADGSDVRQLSANYLNDFTPAVLNDGRILYGRWEYVDRPAIPIQGLWTMFPDGRQLAGYFGNRVLDPATFIEPQAIPGTSAVLCTLTGHNGSCRGAIGRIDVRLGPNAAAGIRNLTPEVALKDVQHSSNGPRGPYQTPYPLDDRHFLVSCEGTILVRDYDGTEQATLLRPSGLGFYNPRPCRPRLRPPVLPRAIDVSAEPWAVLQVQDVYVGLEGKVSRGEIAHLAVVQEIEKSRRAEVDLRAFGFQFPVVSCGATYAPKQVWGYARVESDGSAHFRVPASVPIYFMALDKRGRALQRMRSFTHLMPGETQGCVGCHVDRNQHAATFPSRPLAMTRPPEDLQPPEWGVTGFSYSHVVQPVLNDHCVSCHNPFEFDGEVDLSGDFTDYFNVSYETLAREGFDQAWGGRGYTRSISTYNGAEKNILEVTPRAWGSPASRLSELIENGHPDDRGEPRVKLGDAERRRIHAWIDLNVPYYGTSVSRHYSLKGCRQLWPESLDAVLKDVGRRRCAQCHKGGEFPLRGYVRVTGVENNAFLLAPLDRAAGGTGRCGKPVFASRDDADYQAILQCFEPIQRIIEANPRVDMLEASALSTTLLGRMER
jgi:hypothetical protein